MAPYYPASDPARKHDLLWPHSMFNETDDVIETIESLSSSLKQSATPLPGGKLPSDIVRLATIYTYKDAPTAPKPLSRSPRIWRLVRRELFDDATSGRGDYGGGRGLLRMCDIAVKLPSRIPTKDFKSAKNSKLFGGFVKLLRGRGLVAALACDSAGRIGFVVPIPSGDDDGSDGDDADDCYAARLHYAPMEEFIRGSERNHAANREKKEARRRMQRDAPPLEDECGNGDAGPEEVLQTGTLRRALPPEDEERPGEGEEKDPAAQAPGEASPPDKGNGPVREHPLGAPDRGKGDGRGNWGDANDPTFPLVRCGASSDNGWGNGGRRVQASPPGSKQTLISDKPERGSESESKNMPKKTNTSNNDNRKSDLLLVQEAHRELEKCLAIVRQEEEQKESPSSEMLLERGRNLLKHLDTLRIDNAILTKTKTGKLVGKFRKHPELGGLAKPLITKWKGICHEFDKQREQEQKDREAREVLGSSRQRALDKYRERVNELKGRGQAKPDMVAFRELRNRCTWLHERCHGELNGVPVGLVVTGRGEAAILGIHTNILSGMDSIKEEPCYAVCISGGYKDDEASSSGGTIWYTGSGGQKGGRQVEDQRENSDNLSLLRSLDTGERIRLLRAHGPPDARPPLYRYAGLYECTDSTYEASVDGPRVYKFRLEPVEGKSLFHLERSRRRGAHRPEPAAGRSGIRDSGEEDIVLPIAGEGSIDVRSPARPGGQAARKRKRTSASANAKNRLNAQLAKHHRS